MPPITDEELAQRYASAYSDEGVFLAAAMFIRNSTPDGDREQAYALMKLEEAQSWLDKGRARAVLNAEAGAAG